MGRPEEAERETPRGRFGVQLLAAVGTALAITGNCYSIGWGVAANWQLQQPDTPVRLSTGQRAGVMSIYYVGVAVGCLMGGPVSIRFGSRLTMLLSMPIAALANGVIFLASSFDLLFVGRLILGWSIGIAYSIYPMYVSGTSSPRYRGMFGMLVDIINTPAIIASIVVGNYVSWWWLAILCAAAGTVPAAALLLFLPDDPVWLLTQGRLADAKRAAVFFDIDLEVADTTTLDGDDPKDMVSKLYLFLQRRNLVPLLIVLALAFFCSFSGYLAILTYSLEFFRRAGFQLDASVCSILFCGIRILSSLVASVLIERAGRRVLLITSCAGTGLCYIGMVLCYIVPAMRQLPALPIVLLMSAAFIFAGGLGVVPFCLIGEIFPLRVRQVGSSLMMASYNVAIFLSTLVFPLMLAALGASGLFLSHAAIMLLAAAFVFAFVPETKGLSLASIETLFDGVAIATKVAAPEVPHPRGCEDLEDR